MMQSQTEQMQDKDSIQLDGQGSLLKDGECMSLMTPSDTLAKEVCAEDSPAKLTVSKRPADYLPNTSKKIHTTPKTQEDAGFMPTLGEDIGALLEEAFESEITTADGETIYLNSKSHEALRKAVKEAIKSVVKKVDEEERARYKLAVEEASTSQAREMTTENQITTNGSAAPAVTATNDYSSIESDSELDEGLADILGLQWNKPRSTKKRNYAEELFSLPPLEEDFYRPVYLGTRSKSRNQKKESLPKETLGGNRRWLNLR